MGCAGYRPALCGPGRRHGAQPLDEGGPLHVHSDRDGFLGVPRDRGDLDRGFALVLRVSMEGRFGCLAVGPPALTWTVLDIASVLVRFALAQQQCVPDMLA